MVKNLKKLVEKCAKSTLYCSIATAERSGPWISPVGFALDSKFNVYFITSPKSRKIRNVKRNSSVAVSIFTTAQKANGPKVGIQIQGKAARIKKSSDIEKAYKVYFSKHFKFESVAYFKKRNCEWPFFIIKPKSVYYFDNGRFGEEIQRVR